jgi:hypothetical protein
MVTIARPPSKEGSLVFALDCANLYPTRVFLQKSLQAVENKESECGKKRQEK